MAKVDISKVIRKNYVEVTENNKTKLIEVTKSSAVDHYPEDTTVYVNKYAKGPKAGLEEYWVASKDYIKTTRVTKGEKATALLSALSRGELTIKELAEVAAKNGIVLQ